MKRIRRIGIILFTMLLIFQFTCVKVEASDIAEFYVQTAAVSEDNTIEVCVYLDKVDNLGGVDIELVYDAEKVTFISSSLGESLQSSLSDIYHDIEKKSIHYVVIYSDAKHAHGILFKAVFQLKEGESYQPQLIVNEVVDNSIEINTISYVIQYQQADGTWSDEQDMSGNVAEDVVLEETLQEYGAAEDFSNNGDQETITIDSKNNINNVILDIEHTVLEENTEYVNESEIIGDSIESTENVESTEMTTKDDMGEQQSSSKKLRVIGVGCVLIGIIVFLVVKKRERR